MLFNYSQSFLVTKILLFNLLLIQLSNSKILQQISENQKRKDHIQIKNENDPKPNSNQTEQEKSDFVNSKSTKKSDSKDELKIKSYSNNKSQNSQILKLKTSLSSSKSKEIQMIKKNTIRYINSKIYTKEKVREIYNFIGKDDFDKKKENPTSYNYFSRKSITLTCEDHVKFMLLDFSCVEKLNDKFLRPINKNLFIVQSKYKKYFMRIEDKPMRYELALEKSLKINGTNLNLLEHKVFERRFAGFYRYEENKGLLDLNIKTNTLSYFDKINLMLRLATSLKDIFKYRNMQNPALKINLHPRNILLTNWDKYSFHFITALPTTKFEKKALETPEEEMRRSKNLENEAIINIESQTVFNLGQLFYFMLFKVFPKKENLKIIISDLDKFIRKYKEKNNLSNKVDPDLISHMNSQIIENEEHFLDKELKKKSSNSMLKLSKSEKQLFQSYSPNKQQIEQFLQDNLILENKIFNNIDLKTITMIRMMLISNPPDRPFLSTVIEVLTQLIGKPKFFFDRTFYKIRKIYDSMNRDIEIQLLINDFHFFKENRKNSLIYQKRMLRKFKSLDEYKIKFNHFLDKFNVLKGSHFNFFLENMNV